MMLEGDGYTRISAGSPEQFCQWCSVIKRYSSYRCRDECGDLHWICGECWVNNEDADEMGDHACPWALMDAERAAIRERREAWLAMHALRRL